MTGLGSDLGVPPPGAPPPGGPRPRKKRRYHPKPHAPAASSVRSDINVTPLVDVVLVLLIIFMVVTPMLSRGVKVELPETVHHEKTQDTGQQILVSIDATKRVFVEADPVEDDGITEAVRKVVEERQRLGKGQEIHVRGDKTLTYGDVRGVLEKIHAAGATQVALATDEPKKGP